MVRQSLSLAILAFAVRFTLRHVETRWQIIAFWLIAAGIARAQEARPRLPLWAVLAGAATVAILAAKYVVEGKVLEH